MTDPHTPLDRRAFVAGMAGAVASAGALASSAAAADDTAKLGGIHAIPELAPHWKQLDLAKILRYPAAFLSVSQNKSLYEPWGAQGAEGHRQRGSLPATVKVAKAARKAG